MGADLGERRKEGKEERKKLAREMMRIALGLVYFGACLGECDALEA